MRDERAIAAPVTSIRCGIGAADRPRTSYGQDTGRNR